MPPASVLRQGAWRWLALPVLVALGLWIGQRRVAPQFRPATLSIQGEVVQGMVRIPAGALPLGSHWADRRPGEPLPEIAVAEFWLDETEVTHSQFARFVAETGYLTTAEKSGVADVFAPVARGGRQGALAKWRRPSSDPLARPPRARDPVTCVSWHDAIAFATWAGKRLPTEVEWEYAARGGMYDADYPWGRSETIDGRPQANAWQGWFPDRDRGDDGFRELAPVASFEPNAFGLYDVAGHVWEWCQDSTLPIGATASPVSRSRDRRRAVVAAAAEAPARSNSERVRRGGSWLCCENYSGGIRLSARASSPPDAATNHLGFRCASDASPR